MREGGSGHFEHTFRPYSQTRRSLSLSSSRPSVVVKGVAPMVWRGGARRGVCSPVRGSRGTGALAEALALDMTGVAAIRILVPLPARGRGASSMGAADHATGRGWAGTASNGARQSHCRAGLRVCGPRRPRSKGSTGAGRPLAGGRLAAVGQDAAGARAGGTLQGRWPRGAGKGQREGLPEAFSSAPAIGSIAP